jgi:hypothetical protein
VAVTRLTALLNIREVGERVFSDLAETWWMIGISLVGACLLSFIWILLMRFLAGNPIFWRIYFLAGIPSFSGFSSLRVPQFLADFSPLAGTRRCGDFFFAGTVHQGSFF